MTAKKKIPLSVLELFEPYLVKGINSIRLVKPESGLLKFIDADEKSDFYFFIEQSKLENNHLMLLLDKKPRSKEIVTNYKTWINSSTLENFFKEWVEYIDRYNNIKTIYDDPIEKKYQDEFYAEFEIIDEDADLNSFDLSQQIWIDSYLEKIVLAIESKYDSENNIADLQELKNSALQLKIELTKLSKKIIIKRLSEIWAKARKHGLEILKEIYIEFRKELIKQLIQGQLAK